MARTNGSTRRAPARSRPTRSRPSRAPPVPTSRGARGPPGPTPTSLGHPVERHHRGPRRGRAFERAERGHVLERVVAHEGAALEEPELTADEAELDVPRARRAGRI